MVDAAAGDEGDVRARALAEGRRLAGTDRSPERALPRVRAVLDGSGVSTSSFYWHFRDGQHYWAELLRSIGEHDPVRAFADELRAALEAAGDAIRADPAVAVPTIAALASADLEFHRAAPEPLQLQLALLGACRPDDPLSDVVREVYLDLYGAIEQAHVAGYELLLAAWGRVPREPFSFRSLSITITAMADGFLVRGLFDGATDLVTLFEDAIGALLASSTRRVGEPVDLPRLLDDELGLLDN